MCIIVNNIGICVIIVYIRNIEMCIYFENYRHVKYLIL